MSTNRGAAAEAGDAGRVRRLSPLVRVVLAPNPSPMTLDGTNTYVIEDRDASIVLDPGPADEDHLERVRAEAGRVSLVLLSHWHPDHAEAADELAARTGAPLAAMAGSRAGSLPVSDGDVLGEGRGRLRAVATPGHARDHLCFLLEEDGTLFTGDHILGFGTTVIAHPDGNMREYLSSLERVREIPARRLFPGHGPVVEEPERVVDYYIAHRLEREQQVIDAIRAGARTVEAMVERIYADVDPVLHPVAAMSVAAHLEKLETEGAARSDGDSWRLM